MTLTKPYEATFYIGNDSKKTFSFLFDEVSENFIKVIVKRINGTIYTPTFSVDMELKEVVFGEDEITPTADDIICIYRDTPTIQDTQFNTLQGYNAKALENILSKIVAMIQEMKANGFGTQVLQGEPWSLDLIKPADDGASVQIDYEARVLKKGLYFKMSDGNLQASVNGIDYVTMPKSENIAEFRQRGDAKGNVIFEYRVGNNWFGLATSAEIANVYSKEEIDNKITIINAEIDANAEAIAKTRNDYEVADQEIRDDMNAEDSRLQTQITAQATAITTNKNDIDELGDDVAEIQAKIPESASGSNPLITKQQLLDEEMDIRDDVNEMVGELQTQITAQAAAIATLDSEKLDKNQGDINAGKYLVVGNDGNIELTTSGGGGSGGIGSVAHDETLSGAGTDASPLGVAKNLSVEELTVGTDEGTLNLSITAGVATIATNNGLDIVSQTKFDKAPTTDDNTTWADALDTSLVRKAQVASAMAGFEALPDQSGNSGKFLTTNGTTASWVPALTNTSSASTDSLVILGDDKGSTKTGNTVIGVGAELSSLFVNNGTAIGSYTEVSSSATAIGVAAKATGIRSVQLGQGTNADTNTFKVGNANGNFEMMSADGTIPADRMSATAGTTGQVLTKTDAGMEWQEPSGGTTITLKEYDE